MLKIKFIITITFLLIVLSGHSQRFGAGIGVELKKPMFISDTLTKGNPFFGFNTKIGIFPDDEGNTVFNLYFSYFFPAQDSVAVNVSAPYYYYNELYDAAAVTTKSFSVGITYDYTIPHNISSLLYLAVGGRMGFDRYKFEYDYSDPILTMNTDSIETKGFLNVGLEITPYYDLEKFYIFASALGTYRLSGDEVDYDSHLKIASKFNLGLRAGIIFFFD